MTTPNREYKSSIFTILLTKYKKRALDVYNALNNTSYTNEDDLEVRMLDNTLFLSFRNDVSFVLESRLNIYEQQSTYNPNMPLRDLIYVANLLADIVKNENLYGTKLIKIPLPQFVTFYNGLAAKPERMELKLSDAYEVAAENPQLELKCTFINLNKGYNRDLMNKCRTLQEYTILIDKVRYYQKEMSLSQALEKAADECIAEHVLEDFLRSEKAMINSLSVIEFNIERQLEFATKEGLERGLEEFKKLRDY